MCQGGHWTLDNAKMNVTFMKAFQEEMRIWDIPFDHKDNRIMCFPHIINICTNHVIEKFTNTVLVDNQVEFDAACCPLDPAEQTYNEAYRCDPIALCHSTVRAIRASGKQCDHLRTIICNGNAAGWFKSLVEPCEKIQIPEVQLLHDIRTHWDSVFRMTHRFHELQPISNP